MVKLGTKISKAFKKLGSKQTGRDIVKFGKQALHQADLVERKIVNSLDTAAPLVAVGADFLAPGSGDAVLQANDGLQSVHRSTRQLVKDIPKLGGNSKEERAQNVVNFGDGINANIAELNRSKQLLRDVKNNISQPRPRAPMTTSLL